VGRDDGQVRYLEGHRWGMTGLAFTPDGRALVSGDDDSVHVWDVTTGQELRCIRDEEDVSYWGLALSPDGRMVALARRPHSLRPGTGQRSERCRLRDHRPELPPSPFRGQHSAVHDKF
jgi:WD40 repeat protein